MPGVRVLTTKVRLTKLARLRLHLLDHQAPQFGLDGGDGRGVAIAQRHGHAINSLPPAPLPKIEWRLFAGHGSRASLELRALFESVAAFDGIEFRLARTQIELLSPARGRPQ